VKLLIVDDSNILRKAIRRYLDNGSVEIVGEAGNGKEALRLFQELSPELVTIDITMPEMDGLATLAELMKINSNVKVLVITALRDEATGLKALKLGAKGFLPKPFTEESINNAVQKIIGGSL
jgi:two-component system chemotaxis response regulator CheY